MVDLAAVELASAIWSNEATIVMHGKIIKGELLNAIFVGFSFVFTTHNLPLMRFSFGRNLSTVQ